MSAIKDNNRELEIKRTGLFFPVRIQDTEEVTGIPTEHSPIQKCVVVTTEAGNDRIVQFCSERYSLVPLKEIVNPLEKALKAAGVKFKASYRHWNHSRFYIDYIIEGMDTMIQKGDAVKTKISLRHSYDGGMKFDLAIGLWREVCSNGMMGWVSDKSNKKRHLTGLTAERVEAMGAEIVEQLKEQFSELIKPFEVLADRAVPNWADRLEEVLGAVSEAPVKMFEQISATIAKEAKQLNVPVTDWLIFNGINYELNHNNAINKRPEDRERIDGNVLKYLYNNAPSKKRKAAKA